MTIRPRRSFLFMPGANSRAIAKARTLPVDGIIIDLEDAVAPEAKDAARRQVVEALQQGGFGSREVFIRVNGSDTPWFTDDIGAAIAAAPDGILIPKVSAVAQIEGVGQRMLDVHANHRTRLWAMIETPLAIFNLQALAAAAADTEMRLSGFVVGTNDLAKESRARIVPGRTPMLPWLSSCVLAAHAFGLDVLDGVYNDIADTDGFQHECEQGRDMGFDGKTLIHPSQVDICNRVFSPDANAIAEARKLIAAFEQPENRSKGVVQIDGRMVERMHADTARRTVAIADAIEGRQEAAPR
jgi:citrate lyase subunit beta/citryl-CoA lyase